MTIHGVSFDVVIVGDASYLRGDDTFWRKHVDLPAALDALTGRWVELEPGNPLAASFEDFSMEGVTEAFTDVPDTGVATAKIDSEPVYLVKDNDGDLIAVSQRHGLPRRVTDDSGKPVWLTYDDVRPVTVPGDAGTVAEILQGLQTGA